MSKQKHSLSKTGASFRGKRFDRDEKTRIFNRVNSLYKEKVSPESILIVMQSEGFRRVDGSNLTLSWVGARLRQVIAYNKSESTRKKSGPVKEVYSKKSTRVESNIQMEILGSSLSDTTKVALLTMLSRK